ncbi:replication factor A protein 3-domain-containing protein [Xylariaceae sp. FL1272]|nr:replication factor A protein 3-domain-containing protein [Xylariaceae sp. FL1272]
MTTESESGSCQQLRLLLFGRSNPTIENAVSCVFAGSFIVRTLKIPPTSGLLANLLVATNYIGLINPPAQLLNCRIVNSPTSRDTANDYHPLHCTSEMDSVSTPRISASMLDSHVGANVMVVGQVIQLRGDTALLDAAGQISLLIDNNVHLVAGNGAQIIGKVNPDMSIKVWNAMDLGSNVDFQLAQSVVEVTHQYKELFVFPTDSKMN